MYLENEQIGLLVCVLIILWLIVRINSVIVYRFYRPTCGACAASQAEWDSFKMSCLFKMIRCVDVNLDDYSNKDMAANFDIKGVPTIYKVYPDGCRVLYNGERTSAAYMAWAMLKEH